MRRVLIISPYFPPDNAADMHRIRMSLTYYAGFNWAAEVVAVNPENSDIEKDDFLLQSIPGDIMIHTVNALPKKWTIKIGLGSIALRSLYHYLVKVNQLLHQKKYDLIFFSTTQFPVCILGTYWKKRFGIPYVMDMQDAWHSEYYKGKPKEQRPSKYWFSYRLNKWLEPIAIKTVSGLISVSKAYIDDLKLRYPVIKHIPSSVITFGSFKKDFEIARLNAHKLKSAIGKEQGKIHIVYIGRGGHDMHQAVELLFLALVKGLSEQPEQFDTYRINFIGTSYAAKGRGSPEIEQLAYHMGLKKYVKELTDRIGFYDSLATLSDADILFIPGSDDSNYTASKIFPYLTSLKPVLAILNENSSACGIIKECSPDVKLFTFPENKDQLVQGIYLQLAEWTKELAKPLQLNKQAFAKYEAKCMTQKQTELFDRAISFDNNRKLSPFSHIHN